MQILYQDELWNSELNEEEIESLKKTDPETLISITKSGEKTTRSVPVKSIIPRPKTEFFRVHSPKPKFPKKLF